MSNKLYILLSGIFIVTFMVGIFVVTSKLQEKEQPASKQSTSLAKHVISPKTEKIQHDTTANNAEEDQSLTILNMWYDLAPEAATNGVRLSGDVASSRKIGIHSGLLSAIKPGYKVQLPSLVGGDYLLKLEKVERITDTEVQIYGQIEAGNETYFSTISVMNNAMLAVLSTPNGDFDVNMIDGKGVVYRSEEVAPSEVGAVSDLESFLSQ